MSRLPLGDYQHQISSLVRHLVADLRPRSIGATPFPQPTTHKRAKRASYNLGGKRASHTLRRWHGALPFECVMFSDSVRHQPSSFNSLSYMRNPPILSENPRYSTLKVTESESSW